MELTAKDIMTKDVITIKEDNSIYDAIETLISLNINCLPVLNNEGILTGIVTETDLVYVDKKLNESSYYAYSKLHVPIDSRNLNKNSNRFKDLTIKDVMTKKPRTVKEDTSLDKIIDIIINKGLKTIPVVKDSKVIGIITRKNILKYYLK
ncbi:CBS domain-containing protein [Natronincola ferrireducens]|uniref:CBS domain-containing protein n=1 Tax=Natronincola ferrireducens TaxID=393762 RepID=A0A1G8Z559_9FIRM|nr:CBS domain-containing protein [Natronincola ferrireducens]SDK09535.1 CBS domain-containing protein [Natronincola ferrireducens]